MNLEHSKRLGVHVGIQILHAPTAFFYKRMLQKWIVVEANKRNSSMPPAPDLVEQGQIVRDPVAFAAPPVARSQEHGTEIEADGGQLDQTATVAGLFHAFALQLFKHLLDRALPSQISQARDDCVALRIRTKALIEAPTALKEIVGQWRPGFELPWSWPRRVGVGRKRQRRKSREASLAVFRFDSD